MDQERTLSGDPKGSGMKHDECKQIVANNQGCLAGKVLMMKTLQRRPTEMVKGFESRFYED